MGTEHRGHHLPPGWTEKPCPGCGVVHPREEYGTQSRCRRCVAEYSKRGQAQRNKRRRELYRQDPAKWKDKNANWKRKNAEKVRDSHLRRKYGIPPGTFARLLAEQNGVCAICLTPSDKTLHVDHCHTYGVVRALLCDSCNRGIGHLKEDPAVLRRAAEYVELHRREVMPMPRSSSGIILDGCHGAG